MNIINYSDRAWQFALLLSFITGFYTIPPAQAIELTVIGLDGAGTRTTLTDFRWLIEEDATYHVQRNTDGSVQTSAGGPVIDPNWRAGDPLRNTLAVSFHQSYMPVVAKGEGMLPLACSGPTPADPCLDLDPNKHYFISVLPKVTSAAEGDTYYSMGGTPITSRLTDVTVYVHKNPLPTAQIDVLVHEDRAPINNIWDQGELGLEGFNIILEDAGGRYGASAGVQNLDVFGNPLCTKYQFNDSNHNNGHDPGETFKIDTTTGMPKPVKLKPHSNSGCVTNEFGRVTIRNLAPGKYGVLAVPPIAPDNPKKYVQTSTIEGKKVIDAWVKANEPAFFSEFGIPSPHVRIGFIEVNSETHSWVDSIVLNGGATISGQVVNQHISRPPSTAFNSGSPFEHTTPWVGLNRGAFGGTGVFAKQTDSNGNFEIPNVPPPGAYQLVVWDDNLDIIFAINQVTVNADSDTGTADGTCNEFTDCNLGDVPVFQWFTRQEHYVFNDENENGMRDTGEGPMPEQATILRWRDGTIYQSFPTDGEGFAPYDEVFPFFSWLVAEVDFTRFKATGVTITVDDGGPVASGEQLNPQIQDNPEDPEANINGTSNSRTELGAVLTQGFQGFLGQTSVFEWGKKAYGSNENGGISGVVYYATTRAEDDPRYAAAEPWEPGIPRVTVNLYDLGQDATFGTADDVLLDITTTDSWDDNLPSNCQYGVNAGPYVFRGTATDCYDGLRNWNQVRPAVFDGGYAFGPEIDCSADGVGVSDGAGGHECPSWVEPTTNDTLIGYMKPGHYGVEVIPPPGYEIMLSQDRNVDFGDTFFPSPQLLPPVCIGAEYVVSTELTLFPGVGAPLAGQTLNTCDIKQVNLANGANAAADFFLFTEVPLAGHLIGFILDDTANEFDPNSPQFGEKYAPPFLPVSIRDWTGKEINRTYSDEYGVYNALLPSTYTTNLPAPSGMSPNMLTACMNTKFFPDGSADPLHRPQYSEFCYTFQYMPGTTTYLDTPVVPVASFSGSDQALLDCEFETSTPKILMVSVPGNGVGGGPWLPSAGDGSVVNGLDIVMTSQGSVLVPNPLYDGVGGSISKTIARDYGFGSVDGSAVLVTSAGNTISLTINSWDNMSITATVPDDVPEGTHQLVVTRGDNNKTTESSISVQVGLRSKGSVIVVETTGSIQTAIDNASPEDLILVEPGTYDEMVIMWKPVQLQGWGAGSTIINARNIPSEKLVNWRIKTDSLIENGLVSLLPGQENNPNKVDKPLTSMEGAGVIILGNEKGGKITFRGSRVDGLTVTGAIGGGVSVNGLTKGLVISNNRVNNNSSSFGGGIRLGHSDLTQETTNGELSYTDARNDNATIKHNEVLQNGSLAGAGNISLYAGTNHYKVLNNFVCGNFTLGEGGGIGHFGFSDGNNLIEGNKVIFNSNYNQGGPVNGGGILISGQPPIDCPPDTRNGKPQDLACLLDPSLLLTLGSGNLTLSKNLIQGNLAGSGNGGGISLNRIDGISAVNRNNRILIENNIITNNVAAGSGGGIAVRDAMDVDIIFNTIAYNDNTSTAGTVIDPVSGESSKTTGAGIVSIDHSAELRQLLNCTVDCFTNPVLINNIIWHNRTFSFNREGPLMLGLCPDIGGSEGLTCSEDGGTDAVYSDLGVMGTGDLTDQLNPEFSILSDITGYSPSNMAADPQFKSEYFNGNRITSITDPDSMGSSAIQVSVAGDEGGNYIQVRYGPLTLNKVTGANTGEPYGDAHIQLTSPAMDAGQASGTIDDDYHSEPRPSGIMVDPATVMNPDEIDLDVDIGADELQQPVPELLPELEP